MQNSTIVPFGILHLFFILLMIDPKNTLQFDRTLENMIEAAYAFAQSCEYRDNIRTLFQIVKIEEKNSLIAISFNLVCGKKKLVSSNAEEGNQTSIFFNRQNEMINVHEM